MYGATGSTLETRPALPKEQPTPYPILNIFAAHYAEPGHGPLPERMTAGEVFGNVMYAFRDADGSLGLDEELVRRFVQAASTPDGNIVFSELRNPHARGIGDAECEALLRSRATDDSEGMTTSVIEAAVEWTVLDSYLVGERRIFGYTIGGRISVEILTNFLFRGTLPSKYGMLPNRYRATRNPLTMSQVYLALMSNAKRILFG